MTLSTITSMNDIWNYTETLNSDINSIEFEFSLSGFSVISLHMKGTFKAFSFFLRYYYFSFISNFNRSIIPPTYFYFFVHSLLFHFARIILRYGKIVYHCIITITQLYISIRYTIPRRKPHPTDPFQ